MADRMKLHTTTAHHGAIADVIDKSKRGTAKVSVPLDALKALFMDHGALLGAIGPRNYVYPDPQDKED